MADASDDKEILLFLCYWDEDKDRAASRKMWTKLWNPDTAPEMPARSHFAGDLPGTAEPGGGGHVPPNVFRIDKEVIKASCAPHPPNIESLKVPPPPISKLLRGPCLYIFAWSPALPHFREIPRIKAHDANGRNIVGQQHATLLGLTCCVRLHGTTTMLALVAYGLKPVKLLDPYLPRKQTQHCLPKTTNNTQQRRDLLHPFVWAFMIFIW